MSKFLDYYRAGMAAYDRGHPPAIRTQWSALTAEVTEFFSVLSVSEA